MQLELVAKLVADNTGKRVNILQAYIHEAHDLANAVEALTAAKYEEEINKLHRQLAHANLSATRGWARWDNANKDRQALREEKVRDHRGALQSKVFADLYGGRVGFKPGEVAIIASGSGGRSSTVRKMEHPRSYYEFTPGEDHDGTD